MKSMIISFSVTLLLVAACHSVDIRRILDDAYAVSQTSDSSRENTFVKKLWPEISKLVPELVYLQGFRENDGLQSYLCTTETSFQTKVSNKMPNVIIESGSSTEQLPFIFTTLKAKVEFKKPITFKIYRENEVLTSSRKVGGRTQASYNLKQSRADSVSYSFNGEFTIRFNIRIPNLLLERDKIPTTCVIYVDSVDIEDLSEPTLNKNSEIGKTFWNSVKEEDIYTMMRIGMMKGLQNNVLADKSTKNKVFCLSDYFGLTLIDDVYGHFDDDYSTLDSTGPPIQKIIYKKRNTAVYIKSVQLGIKTSIDLLKLQPKRDALVADFTQKEETLVTGSEEQFTLVTYSPVVFKYLRKIFGFTEDQYDSLLCQTDLIPLSNPGRSGSGLYRSRKEDFIIKTVQEGEADFVQTFFPGYFLNLQQNPNTLLPKFFGLYWYQQSILGNNPRFIVMNNLIPAGVRIDQKYDLKGSTFERDASEKEKSKPSPTYKDNDFTRHHKGIFLKETDYYMLVDIIKRDSIVLQSFRVIDYSLLLSLHYEEALSKEERDMPYEDHKGNVPCEQDPKAASPSTTENKPGNRVDWSTGIPAYTSWGKEIKLYVGIIDTLQTFKWKKKFETFWKRHVLYYDGFSVIEPGSYAGRFTDFMTKVVFKKMQRCPNKNKSKLSDLFQDESLRSRTETMNLRTTLEELLKDNEE